MRNELTTASTASKTDSERLETKEMTLRKELSSVGYSSRRASTFIASAVSSGGGVVEGGLKVE
jgi:hypothetical protein